MYGAYMFNVFYNWRKNEEIVGSIWFDVVVLNLDRGQCMVGVIVTGKQIGRAHV